MLSAPQTCACVDIRYLPQSAQADHEGGPNDLHGDIHDFGYLAADCVAPVRVADAARVTRPAVCHALSVLNIVAGALI
jgi:hypothetical protein